jgi:hypothetical protein
METQVRIFMGYGVRGQPGRCSSSASFILGREHEMPVLTEEMKTLMALLDAAARPEDYSEKYNALVTRIPGVGWRNATCGVVPALGLHSIEYYQMQYLRLEDGYWKYDGP